MRYVHSYKNITKLEPMAYGNNFPKLSLRPWSVVMRKFYKNITKSVYGSVSGIGIKTAVELFSIKGQSCELHSPLLRLYSFHATARPNPELE